MVNFSVAKPFFMIPCWLLASDRKFIVLGDLDQVSALWGRHLSACLQLDVREMCWDSATVGSSWPAGGRHCLRPLHTMETAVEKGCLPLSGLPVPRLSI